MADSTGLAPQLSPWLGDVLARSWQRSQQAGVLPQGRKAGAPHAWAAQLARAMQRQYELISHARPVMDYVGQQVAGTPSLLILADAQGMLLRTLGLARARACMVEHRLFHTWHAGSLPLHLHARAEGLGTLGEGLLALAESSPAPRMPAGRGATAPSSR